MFGCDLIFFKGKLEEERGGGKKGKKTSKKKKSGTYKYDTEFLPPKMRILTEELTASYIDRKTTC